MAKKLLTLLTMFVLALLTMIAANACAMRPELISYKVVTQKNNTPVYTLEYDENQSNCLIKKAGNLAKDKTLTIIDETLDGTTVYLRYQNKNDDLLFIRKSDIKLADSSVYSASKGYQTEKMTYMVMATKGVELHKAPCFGSDTICTIPNGTTLTSTIAENKPTFEIDGEEWENPTGWFYTTYNSKSGWVYNYTYLPDTIEYNGYALPEVINILPKENRGTIRIVGKETVGCDFNNNEVCKIPAGQTLECVAYNEWYHTVVVRWSNQYVFVHIMYDEFRSISNVAWDPTIEISNYRFVANRATKLTLYTTPDCTTRQGTVKLHRFDAFNWLYCTYVYDQNTDTTYACYYVELNGVCGWFMDADDNIVLYFPGCDDDSNANQNNTSSVFFDRDYLKSEIRYYTQRLFPFGVAA